MADVGVIAGMGRLFVGGMEVGAVYYELKGPKPSGPRQYQGTVSGDPSLLARAFKEGGAVLILDNGIEASVSITDVYRSEGEALIEMNADPSGLRAD